MIHENNFVDEPVFDPKIHLAYSPPTQKFTLEDLKLPRSETSSDIAGTTPFPILSPEGVRAYRRALFTPSILQQCASNPFPGTLILRNAADHSTFINDFWTHPTTMRLISEAAGLPLSIVMRTEIGHTNIQASGDSVEEMIAGLTPEPSMTKVPLTEEEKRYDPLGTNSIIPWHYDSYPYVCVLMLSDTEGMLGGETYIKGGDGVPVKVAGPALGHGVLLQGGEVQHLAARAIGVKERITTITSYCAKVEGLYDSSYISNIRPYCDRNVLYKQWAQFRLEKMQAEISVLQRQLSQSQGPVDVSQINKFVDKQVSYMKRTARQLIPQDEYDAIYKRFGKDTIQNAHRLWKKAEDHPDFNKRIVAIDQSNWMPESPLWADLAETQITVRLGKVLQAQQGRYKWEKARGFVMGDELLRQGLPEIFLLWLDATGLYSVVASEESVQVVKGSGFASMLLGYFGGVLRALRKAFVW